MSRSFLLMFAQTTLCTISCILGGVSYVSGQDQPETTAEKPTGTSTPKRIMVSKDFPGDDWVFFSGKKDAKFAETWKYVVDVESKTPYISCSGQPYGYLRTKKKYRNFDFGLEWRFPQDENGNSGILLFTNGDDRIWPTSLQVQLQQPFASSSFPSGGAKTSNELRNVPMLSRPVNQWNRCVVTSREGTVTIVVNDQKVGTIKDCKPFVGAISLQSEGSEIHFRNLWIIEYPSEAETISKAALRRNKRNLLKLKRQGLELVR